MASLTYRYKLSHPSARAQGRTAKPTDNLALVIGGAGVFINGLLAVRFFAQMGDSFDFGRSLLVQLTDPFVEPFKVLEPSSVNRSTGLIEISTLIAFEFYLVAALITISLLHSWPLVMRTLSNVNAVALPVAASASTSAVHFARR